MKLTPLVLHAGVILPRYTALFSDPFPLTSIVVTAGGNVVLTTTTPHGVTVGSSIAVSITDSDTPNPITSAVVGADGDVTITTQYAHRLTTTPDPDLFDQWSELAKLAGFSSASINGNRQIVGVPTSTTVVIRPGAALAAGAVALTGNERLLERLEQELIGWHKVTATGASTLAFATPAAVSRSYTAENPVAVRNIRVFGALDYETALSHYVADDGAISLTDPVMFVLPVPVESMSRNQIAVSGADNRIMVRDGFTVLVLIPSHSTAAHVAAIDLAQGQIFRAVMRTFRGLKIARSEYAAPGEYQATFVSHNGAVTRGNRAIYAHEYVFDMPAEMTDCDAVSPFEWSQIDDGALGDGGGVVSIYPSDPVPWRDLDITGILHDGYPSPLTGTYVINPGDA